MRERRAGAAVRRPGFHVRLFQAITVPRVWFTCGDHSIMR